MSRIPNLLIIGAMAASHWILWLAYTNNVGYREIIAGSIAAAISTVAGVVFAHQCKVCYRFRLTDLSQAIYLPWHILADTWNVLGAVAKQLFTRAGVCSLTAAVPFEVGGDDPKSAGRRALAVTLTTITPNSIVLGIVRDQRLMLYHQLVPDDLSGMTRHLGAQP